MDTSEYRAQVEAEVAKAADQKAPSVEDVVEAVPQALLILADTETSHAERLGALRTVKAATFLGESFDPYRADFIGVLRTLATDNALDLRSAALESLSASRDHVGQNMLIEGLLDPGKALIPAASALTFLSLDEHSSVAPLARLVLDRDEGIDAKVAALRTLTVDPSAQDIFERVMRDKNELRDVRKIGAVGLQKVNEAAFQRVAQEIAVDDSDFSDIRATAWNGLAQTPLAERLLSRPTVRASAEALGDALETGAFKDLLGRLTPQEDN